MGWCIEQSEDPESGSIVWTLQDAPGERGAVWATFYDRVAATACLRGYREIGFTPWRPDKSPAKTLAATLAERARGLFFPKK